VFQVYSLKLPVFIPKELLTDTTPTLNFKFLAKNPPFFLFLTEKQRLKSTPLGKEFSPYISPKFQRLSKKQTF